MLVGIFLRYQHLHLLNRGCAGLEILLNVAGKLGVDPVPHLHCKQKLSGRSHVGFEGAGVLAGDTPSKAHGGRGHDTGAELRLELMEVQVREGDADFVFAAWMRRVSMF
jgi:hypothetical protein